MDLAITAIFQNEARFLKEWLDFHIGIGVQFFYLFDHLSSDSPRKVLEPYISCGRVHLVSWPIAYSDVYEWTELQCLAYERALHWAAGKTKWLAILDVDEFLFAPDAILLDALSPFEAFGGVAVNWQLFGTSGVKKVRSGALLRSLNFRAPVDQPTNLHVKSIVRPERVLCCENAHSMTYKEGFYQVDTNGVRFEGCLSPTVLVNRLRIHHYTLRDEEFLMTQKLPRLKKWWPKEDWGKRHGEMNQVEDLTIHRFIQ